MNIRTGSTGTALDNIPMMREEFWGTTTGIEPYFSWQYFRASRLGKFMQTVPFVEDYMKENGISDVSELPNHFVTAMEMSPMEHIKVQATIQKWTDSSISKTANAPSDFTVEQTNELYLEGYKMGLKGVTIYRDASRDTQVLATTEEGAKLSEDQFPQGKAKAEEEVVETVEEPIQAIKRESMNVPSRLYGMREKIKYQSANKISKAYIHIYTNENGEPIEVWINPTEPSDKEMADALGRMTTQFLRFGATGENVEQAVKHLKTGKTMMSLPYKVGKLLSDVFYGKIESSRPAKTATSVDISPEGINTVAEEIAIDEPITGMKLAKCADCGANSYDKANCLCYSCGFSSCN